MKILDLTHRIYPGMPVYPGTETPIFEQANTLEADGFEEKKITFYSHTGTHLDVPRHLLEGGKSLDGFGIDAFTGSGVVVDVSGKRQGLITVEDLEGLGDRIRDKEFVLFYTGWSRYWGEQKYYSGYPVLSLEAAQFLAESAALKGVGGDFISIDAGDAMELDVHRLLLGRDILIIENLTNLKALIMHPFRFLCLPLKLAEGDGSPVRAVAIMD